MSVDPATDRPNTALTSDPKREAIDTTRGFDWQRWLSILAWLDLEGEDILRIEWAEDFAIERSAGGGRTVQAKNLAAPITLGQKTVQEILERAWARPPTVQTLIWTSAKAGRERGAPFGGPGVLHWREAEDGKVSPERLQAFLSSAKSLSAEARTRIASADAAEFRRILGQVRWVIEEDNLETLRGRAAAAAEARMTALGIRNASLSRDVAAALLFEKVAEVGTHREASDRRLTRVDLDKDLVRWHRERLDGATPEILAQLGAATLAVRRVDRPAPRAAEPWSFSWFVYSAQTIPLVGREDEYRQLRAFAEVEAPFQWWALGGPGGIGKSRLAQDVMLSLGEAWTTGFAPIAELQKLLGQLTLQEKPILLAIDYAAVDGRAVADFLRGCFNLASPSRCVRVLLIDRDPDATADWWRSALPPMSSQTAMLEACLHAPPLRLQPLVDQDHDILEAWLEAAGATAAPSEATKAKIQRLCGGNPLLLGFAAAALAHGDDRFGGVADLLDGLSRREWRRMRERARSEGHLLTATHVAAAATLVRAPLGEPQDDQLVVLTIQGADGEDSVLMMRDGDGPHYLPTFADIAELEHRELFVDLFAKRDRTLGAMGRLSEPDTIAAMLDDASALFGLRQQVQPDLLGEFFLAQYWRPQRDNRADSPPRIADEQLFETLNLAWIVAPQALLFTINEVRHHPWAREGVLRALGQLPRCVTPADRAEDVAQLAGLLFNGTIKLGGVAPSAAALREVVEALTEVTVRRPDVPEAAYRRLQGLMNILLVQRSPQRDLQREILAHSLTCMDEAAAETESLDLYLVDIAVDFGRAAVAAPAVADVADVADFELALEVMQRAASARRGAPAALLNIVSAFVTFSSTVSNPTIPAGAEKRERLDMVRQVLAPLTSAAAALAALGLPSSSDEVRQTIAKGLINCSQAALKVGELREVERLARQVLDVGETSPTSEAWTMIRLHAQFNLALAHIAADDAVALQTTVSAAFDAVSPALGAIGPYGLLVHFLNHALGFATKRPVLLPWAIGLLAETPWPAEDRAFRDFLFSVARGASVTLGPMIRQRPPETSAVLDLAARDNPSPDAVALLRLAWWPFDSTAAETDAHGLLAFLEALKGGNLQERGREHMAGAIVGYWMHHRRLPVLAGQFQPFKLEANGKEIVVLLAEAEGWSRYRFALAD